MTAKEKVRQVYPKACAKRYFTQIPGTGGYTLVWADRRESQRLASGKTAAEAWKRAAQLVKA